ncbi:Lrp/AsnC family transcriptional regulator [Achromobacter xylosoxidans]|uniref:Lrp/AsnC family transcriptional regulator n=1 Tax=Alcaligenes xylosoxydans xylosoxydans TaxID=85698 RepID=UPI000B491C56|nr:AsnC family transcriptional regulator [Achromobacter xylosoxidans]
MLRPKNIAASVPLALDAADRKLINRLQGGFPISPRPFADVAQALGLDEDAVIARVARLRECGALSRFGPLFQIERAGGAYCLAAMAVPQAQWERVVALVNRRIEVAHNYRREHALNMWFVLAAADPADVAVCLRAIEQETGLPVLAFPKEREYFLEMKLEV